MTDSASNGAADLTPDQEAQLVVMRYVAGAVQHLTGCSDEAAIKSAERSLVEADQLNPVIEDASGKGADQHPRWGVAIETGEGQGTLIANKPCKAQTKEEQIQALVVLAIVTSPIARAAAYAQGFKLSFFQAPADKPKSKLIVPG